MLSSALISTFGWLIWEVPESVLETDYCGRAQDRLIEQFEGKENIQKYLCSLIESLQELEFVFGDLLTERGLSSASGAQLDGLGDIVGLERQGLTDNEYRTAIRFQIGILESNGEPETLIALTKFLTDADEVHLIEIYPARVWLFSNGPGINASTVSILKESAPAGVEIELYGSESPEGLFTVGPDTGDPDTIGQGFFEPNYAPDADSGGELVEKYV